MASCGGSYEVLNSFFVCVETTVRALSFWEEAYDQQSREFVTAEMTIKEVFNIFLSTYIMK